MRIAEKTLELNFCAQANAALSKRLIWFGLTQRQEARAGFDACTKHRGRLLIFQFKASNFTVRSKARRFYASHDQMVQLQKRWAAYRSVFYVFPLIGTTLELTKHPDLLSESWLLDVARLPNPMPPPTKNDGSLRKARVHYVDVLPSRALIHSDSTDVELVSSREFFKAGLPRADGVASLFNNDFERFWGQRHLFRKAAVGLVVLE